MKWSSRVVAVLHAPLTLLMRRVRSLLRRMGPHLLRFSEGAELWAVQVVRTPNSLPEKTYTDDWKTVQAGVNASGAWVSSANRRLAKIWIVLHVGLDHGGQAGRVVWMPAHTVHNRIGEVRCGDGSGVNEFMWAANQVADLLAKKGARLVA